MDDIRCRIGSGFYVGSLDRCRCERVVLMAEYLVCNLVWTTGGEAWVWYVVAVGCDASAAEGGSLSQNVYEVEL
jgi:hypothetical protein